MGADTTRARRPWPRSLSQRIIVSYGALFGVVLVALMVWVGRVVYVAQRDEVVYRLERQALLAADALEDPLSGFGREFEDEARRQREHGGREHEERDDHERDEPGSATRGSLPRPGSSSAPRLQRVAANYASNTGARVTILNEQGYVLAASEQGAPSMARLLGPDDVLAYARQETASAVRVDPATGRRDLYVTAPIISGRVLLGFVQFAVPFAFVTGRIWTLVLTLGGFGLFALALSSLLGTFVSTRLVRPLRGLEQASLAMAAGDLSQRVAVETDDEIGALARAFNHMADRVQDVVQQQRLFVANASHELRTPLTNIKLRSEALLSGVDDPAVHQRYLQEIDQESDRLARLANTLLDLSRLDEARDGTQAGTADPGEVLRGIIDLTRARAAAAGIQFDAHVADGLPHVRIATDSLEAILLNLLDNAVKYTPAGGTVTLGAGAAGGQLRIEVRDTGRGIPAPDLPHVFERFYRVDKSRTRGRAAAGADGVGLGLAIVKQLVDRCGGRIEIASDEGAGTVVSVYTPLVEPSPL